MYKQLDMLLSSETTIDSWYDDGSVIAGEILAEFNLNDWDELTKNVYAKPLDWQKKLAYCLDNECNMHELNILLILLTVPDKELSVICVDTLRSFTTHDSKTLIVENPLVIKRVNELIPTSGPVVQKILEDFLVKMKN
ncbi:hypothetical protein [Metabacillus sp. FJAT-52054]|uniref:DUF5071 domain-containing protein n=1 Tax=Metabacillus sediminis TaxID=3117746 RepID=A0ABZ2NJL8_9BACI